MSGRGPGVPTAAGGMSRAEALGLGGHHRADDGQDEDVAGREVADALVEPGGDGQRGEDDGELTTGQHRVADGRRLDPVEAVQPGRVDPGRGGQHHGHHDGDARSREHGDDVHRVDGQAEVEEEDRPEGVPQRVGEGAQPRRLGGGAEDQADHEGADRVRHPQRLGDAGGDDREPDEDDDHDLLVVGARPAVPTSRRAVAGDRAEPEQEGEGGPMPVSASAESVGAAEHGLQQREVERQEDVLDHRDAQDGAGLAVAEPAGLDDQLGDDRGGRDAHDPGDHQRLRDPPAEAEAVDQAATDVEDQVDRRRRHQPAATRDELVEGELEAEVEQQEDESEPRHQLEVVRVADQVDAAGARPEDDAGEHEQRDRGEAEPDAAAGQQPAHEQGAAQRDERVSGVGHAGLLTCRVWVPACASRSVVPMGNGPHPSVGLGCEHTYERALP